MGRSPARLNRAESPRDSPACEDLRDADWGWYAEGNTPWLRTGWRSVSEGQDVEVTLGD